MTRRKFLVLAIAIVVAGLFARILVGAAKTDFHVDEGISLAITNGSWKPPVVEPLFDRWMAKGELEELAFNANLRLTRRVDAQGIAQTTARDVHPPLFYWLFALARIAVRVDRHVAAALFLNGLCFVATALCVVLLILRANRGSAVAARKVALVALAIFSFSAASVALTSFMRMYELLQAACLSFACLAAYVVFPRASGADTADAAPATPHPLAIIGLSVVACLGALTHYHFLLFAFFVSVVSAAILLSRLRVSSALWCAFACVVGLYAAWRIFPDMRLHLIGSDRSLEGVAFASKLVAGDFGGFLHRSHGYLGLTLRYVPALWAVALAEIAVALCVIPRRAILSRAGPRGRDSAHGERAEFSAGFYPLLAVPCVAVFLVVSVTTPFLSLRYIAPYVPLLSVALASALCRALSAVQSPRLRALAVGLSFCLIASSLPLRMPTFHDEYATDRSPAYFADDAPIIVVSDRRGFAWKNMLPYLAIPRHKRVYVTMRYDGGNLRQSLLPAIRSSGGTEAYAMVDVLFPNQPSMERVGFFGFFAVYRVTME